MLDRWFLAHPRSVGESYFEHQRMAWRFSASLFKAAAACLIHGFVPGLFQNTGSRAVTTLHEHMVLKRMDKLATPISESQANGFVISAARGPRSAGAWRRADP